MSDERVSRRASRFQARGGYRLDRPKLAQTRNAQEDEKAGKQSISPLRDHVEYGVAKEIYPTPSPPVQASDDVFTLSRFYRSRERALELGE